MDLEPIAGPDDERVADYRIASDPDLLRTRGLFVAEGRLVVRRLIEDGRWRVRSVLVNEAAHRSLQGVLEQLPPGTPVFVGRPGDFRALTGYHVHRGCLALGERAGDRDFARLAAASKRLVVLEGVGNPDNIGGVFRNASALGADAVLLDPACSDPLYRKAIRTSMGASLRVPFARLAAWPEALEAIRAQGFLVAALTPRPPAQDLMRFASGGHPERIALVAGAEGAGISEAVERLADVRVRIPVRAAADSLNIAVAIGIALHALESRYTA